jgi:hypothetical protein
MKKGDSLFVIWGVRRMARDLKRPASTVHGWKKEGRIPAGEQPYVLAIAEQIGIPITAEHVVFPLGRSVLDVANGAAAVVCDHPAKAQQAGKGA